MRWFCRINWWSFPEIKRPTTYAAPVRSSVVSICSSVCLPACQPVSLFLTFCLSGFIPVLFVFIDIDECNASVPVCDINAHCQNTRGSYMCSCKAGFTGDRKICTHAGNNLRGTVGYLLHDISGGENYPLLIVDWSVSVHSSRLWRFALIVSNSDRLCISTCINYWENCYIIFTSELTSPCEEILKTNPQASNGRYTKVINSSVIPVSL